MPRRLCPPPTPQSLRCASVAQDKMRATLVKSKCAAGDLQKGLSGGAGKSQNRIGKEESFRLLWSLRTSSKESRKDAPASSAPRVGAGPRDLDLVPAVILVANRSGREPNRNRALGRTGVKRWGPEGAIGGVSGPYQGLAAGAAGPRRHRVLTPPEGPAPGFRADLVFVPAFELRGVLSLDGFAGVDFKIKTVELRGKKIRLQIWDTAGQERFNSITSAYYRSAKGIILVYDITKKETFDDLPKWMKMIDKYASEDAELLLVGNKLDCELDREVSRQQGEKFAQQITGMRFCEASAKDNFNVDEIFLKLVDDILKKMPLDVLRNELSNSILSLQPEPEVPPELPPPRPHVRCC
ncbi:ras-related protein Rab-12 [Fukomys damarensis]|uniref:ras-related protein Rab-12 n=1 Tax=Fukomys damarensis TaxID=885580 RepID=UPI00145525EF|nr:ras-related protein Rab-12 [Fukomys damarensis]